MVGSLLNKAEILSVLYTPNTPTKGIKITKKILRSISRNSLHTIVQLISEAQASLLDGNCKIQLIQHSTNDYICAVFSEIKGKKYRTIMFLSEV